MATYNGAKFIREQIDSILAQSIQDFEVVISDDCSTDDTWKILKEYSQNDYRIKVFQNEKNLGIKDNFERALRLCKGEFIALSDQDDIWLPNHLEILMDAMEDNVQIVCARPLFVDEDNKILPRKYDYFKMDLIPKKANDIARHIILESNTYQGASMLIRKNFLDVALPIPGASHFHDNWFALLSCFTGGLLYVDKPILRYRRSVHSVTIDRMHNSPLRKIIGITINSHYSDERLAFIKAIRTRVGSLEADQRALLNCMENMLLRRNSLIGRILNLPYLLIHFRVIYATRLRFLFV